MKIVEWSQHIIDENVRLNADDYYRMVFVRQCHEASDIRHVGKGNVQVVEMVVDMNAVS